MDAASAALDDMVISEAASHKLSKVVLDSSSVADAVASDDDDSDRCVVCFEGLKTHAMILCGHQCVCGPCGVMIVESEKPLCPICREPVMTAVCASSRPESLASGRGSDALTCLAHARARSRMYACGSG